MATGPRRTAALKTVSGTWAPPASNHQPQLAVSEGQDLTCFSTILSLNHSSNSETRAIDWIPEKWQFLSLLSKQNSEILTPSGINILQVFHTILWEVKYFYIKKFSFSILRSPLISNYYHCIYNKYTRSSFIKRSMRRAQLNLGLRLNFFQKEYSGILLLSYLERRAGILRYSLAPSFTTMTDFWLWQWL